MTHTFKLARRTARLRAVALVAALVGLGACDADRLGPVPPGDAPAALADSAGIATDSAAVDGDTLTDAQLEANELLPEAAFVTGNRAKGIAFGHFDQPKSMLGGPTSGAVVAAGPGDVIRTLQAARRAGARVIIRMSGRDNYFRNGNRTLNLGKWKARVARFKRVNLKPYIADGTLLGHYILDEPHNSDTWRGQVPYKTIEAMAKYSKQLWPGLTTVVRAYPDWLSKASFRWKYLDAAWAQYSGRKGEIKRWTREQSSFAKREGLGLIVGLNFLNGGDRSSRIKGLRRGAYAMSAKQVKAWGSVLVNDSRACGFFSWKYSRKYFGRSDIRAALATVAKKAKSRDRKSCRG